MGRAPDLWFPMSTHKWRRFSFANHFPSPIFSARSVLYPTFSNISRTLIRPSLSSHCCFQDSSTNMVPSALILKILLRRLSMAFSDKTGGGIEATANSTADWGWMVLLDPRPLPPPLPISMCASSGNSNCSGWMAEVAEGFSGDVGVVGSGCWT